MRSLNAPCANIYVLSYKEEGRVDVLNDMLEAVKLSGDVFFRCDFSGPWGMQIDETPVAEFHLVVEGECWVEIAGYDNRIILQQGDIILFPHGHAHVLLDAPETRPLPASEIIGEFPPDYGTVKFGDGGGKRIGLLCGYFSFDRHGHSALINAFPSFIHLECNRVAADFPWLVTTMQFIDHETRASRPGTEATVRRLVEVLFVQILRAYIETSTDASGLLGAIAEPRLGRALEAMHGKPERHWTLESLASIAGMSRTAFAARFLARVGQPPMQYLTEWRMHCARAILETTRRSMGDIAETCGYMSESSFSKAFKKQFGQSPGAARKGR